MEPSPSVVSPSHNRLDGPTVICASAWATFKAHWKKLTYLVFIPLLFSVIGSVILTIAMPEGADKVADRTLVSTLLWLIGAIITIIGIIFSVIIQPALIDAIRKVSSGNSAPLDVHQQLRTGFGYFWQALLLMIMVSFIYLGSMTLFVIPAIVVGIFYSFYIYSLVLDGKKGFEALTESYSLVKGRWWGVLGRFIFLGVIYLVFILIASGASFLIDLACGFAIKSDGGTIVSDVLNLCVSSLTIPFLTAYVYYFYNSLKATRLPAVPTKTFKHWLIAFICVGILTLLMLPVIAGIIYSSGLVGNMPRSAAEQRSVPTMLGDTQTR